MHENILVKFTLQITCQWMAIERYKLSALYALFYIEKWMNVSVFYSRTVFDHISFVFHYFELIFFKDRCIYGEERMGWFWGCIVAAATATAAEKGYQF